MSKKEAPEQRIIDRLDVLINLLYDLKEFGSKTTVKDKINYLAQSGLDNKSIAKILRVSEKHVAKEKSLGKK